MISKNQNQPATIQKVTSEEVLNQHDTYITIHTRRFALHHRITAPSEVLDLEVDELTQRVRIKFWKALQKSEIHTPHTYIQRIIGNEYIDLQRQHKRTLPLPTDDEEYWPQVTMRTLEASDPANLFQQMADESDCLYEAIPIILDLPPRQQRAMICSLREQVDDPVQLGLAFRNHKKNIEDIQWPADKAEKQLMGASLSVARRKLRCKLGRESQIN